MTDNRENVSSHLLDGIEAVSSIYERELHDRTAHQRTIDAISRGLSRPAVLYTVIAACTAWMVLNIVLELVGGAAPDPAPFFHMQGAICFGALVTALVLSTAQRRQGQLAEQRAHLDLQVNLLAEKKLAKLIALVEELRRDSPSIRDRKDPEAEAMSVPADPDMVVRAIDSGMLEPNG